MARSLVPTWHDGEPAVNVKDHIPYANVLPYARLIELLPEATVQCAYDECAAYFWGAAHILADGFGYGETRPRGRSDGWLHVATPPDLEDELEKLVWLSFATTVHNLMPTARSMFLRRLMKEVEGSVRSR